MTVADRFCRSSSGDQLRMYSRSYITRASMSSTRAVSPRQPRTCASPVLPAHNATAQVVSGRLELATNLLLRWAVLVAALLALGYVTKYSEEYSRRVVVTWVLVTPVLLVLLQLLLHSITRALL